MRRHRLMALVGLLVLGGCSGDDPRSLGPVPTAPTTSTTTPATTLPVTSTAPATTSAPATTVRASTTTTAAAGPVLVDGIPQVTATPSRAPVGGRVRIEGTGFTDQTWQGADAPLWLAGGSGCNFYAQATHSVTVSPAGRLAGEFTVPDVGGCRMSDMSVARSHRAPTGSCSSARRASSASSRSPRPPARASMWSSRPTATTPPAGSWPRGWTAPRPRGWSARSASRPCPSADRPGWRSTASFASRRPERRSGPALGGLHVHQRIEEGDVQPDVEASGKR